MNLDYPKEKMEIIFASDASTDGTDEIIRAHENDGIKLVRAPHRGGKEYAQKCAIEQARGEIIIFSDAATILEKDGIRNIVANFSDPGVGCVSSEDRFIDENGKLTGEGAYVKYEMFLRKLESRVNSVVGLSGSFFAARREVCRDWPHTIPSDFNTLLNTVKQGFRGISDPGSVGIYLNIKDESKEFERKVRTVTRGISALMANAELLNPLRFGLFSFQLWSHKVMRWLVPFFLLTAMIANCILAVRKSFYGLVLVLHGLFYLFSFMGATRSGSSIIFRVPFYFYQVNRAIAWAWVKYFRGERYVTWTPSQR
ncbi:glycosyltransferase [archaeon]|nr:glycosyltransferase [archaeon]